jgi:hypothetical protein
MPVAAAPLRLSALCAIALAACALPATATAKKTAAPKLPASFQKRYHVKSATADPDHDGLTNFTEYQAHTNPKKADTDSDGIEDRAEDFDHDKLDAATEQRAGTDPGRKDSDGDGTPDAREDSDHDGLNNLAEQNTANDPGDPDSDDDGVKDGSEHAGQVVSFDGGDVVIRLASTGKTVTGTIDAGTTVECNATADYESAYDDGAAKDTNNAGGGASDASGADGSGDPSVDPGTDPSADDTTGDTTASATAAATDPTAGDPTADDPTVDDGSATDSATDPCFDQILAPGAWVHEAELSTDQDGTVLVDTLALVDDQNS